MISGVKRLKVWLCWSYIVGSEKRYLDCDIGGGKGIRSF